MSPQPALLASRVIDKSHAAVPLAELVADEPEAVAEPVTRRQPDLYRVFWRWHFYAGILVGPVLFVVAVTGAMYIFKDEFERVIYPNTMFVVPQTATVPLDRQVDIVQEAFPGWKPDTVEIDADPTRAISVRIRGRDSQSERVYVNPHTGTIQGSIGDGSLFRVVLAIHRRLFIGTIGRVVVELVTCWTIILLVTGLYLWFPRRRKKTWGVFVPRLRAKPYTILRDLHAICGALVMPIALAIAATGLIYTLAWGTLYQYATIATGGDAKEGTKSMSSRVSSPLPLDQVVAIVRARYPEASFIDLGLSGPNNTLVARARLGESVGPRNRAVLTMDRSTGAVLAVKTSDQLPALSWWRTKWNYPLHVGSILGTPTKVLWLIACIVLAGLPVTGMCMWWKRRPEGRTGFPRQPERSVPWWLIGMIGLIGALLPVAGLSVLLILAGELFARRLSMAS